MSTQPIPPAVSDDKPDFIGIAVTLVALVALGAFWFLKMNIPFMLAGVVVISIVIWQACDPFADAAQWVGKQLHIPGSVRGATLDAIASSMPELFTGIFFVVVALTGVTEATAIQEAGAEGYGSAIATCAGSAVYNMMLIPAVCAIMISFYRPSRPTIDVEDEVILRDGLWFLGCELALLIFLFQEKMEWWMGIVFLIAYAIYIIHLTIDARRYRKKLPILRRTVEKLEATSTVEEIQNQIQWEQKIKVSKVLVMNIQEEIHGEDDDNDDVTDAGVLFGIGSIPLSHLTAWPLLAVCTAIAAAACYFLVEMTNGLAEAWAVPSFFVAVIIAAAASSVPDTFLSIGASLHGDDDGAVSNAFGSNIFDICICLSIPLLVNSYLTNWDPVSLTQNGEPIPGLKWLRILLWLLSLITLMLIWHKRQLTRGKAFILIALYLVFVGYAVYGSFEHKAKVPAESKQENKEAQHTLLESRADLQVLSITHHHTRCHTHGHTMFSEMKFSAMKERYLPKVSASASFRDRLKTIRHVTTAGHYPA